MRLVVLSVLAVLLLPFAKSAPAGAPLAPRPLLGVAFDATDPVFSDVRGLDDLPPVLIGWEVVLLPAREDLLGVTWREERRIEIFARRDGSDAMTIAHEMAHAVDLECLDGSQRDLWLELRGSDAVWWVEDTGGDFASGAGDFAETFAAAHTGGVSLSRLGPPSLPMVQLADRWVAECG